jgi:hypothetical protein
VNVAVALLIAVVVSFVSGCGGEERAQGCTEAGPFGDGREQVWLLEPDGEPHSVVLFAHGWTAVDPGDWHRGRLDHLCAEGSPVLFPRYQVDELDTFEDGLDGFRRGVQAGFARTEGNDLPVVAVGYSFGGALVDYYAGHAKEWEVPVPRSVLSIFPTTRVPGRDAGTPPPTVDFVVLTGDRDEVVGTTGADDLRTWLEGLGRRVDYRLVRSTQELEAIHEALKADSRASTETFWEPIDDLVEAARESR